MDLTSILIKKKKPHPTHIYKRNLIVIIAHAVYTNKIVIQIQLHNKLICLDFKIKF